MSTDALQLTATMEDYLKTIFRLSLAQRVVRMRDIARSLGVAPSTATGAVNTLTKRGLATHERYEDVVLTDRGQEIAEDVHRRHEELTSFFARVLLLEPEMAEEEACRLEHGVSAYTLERLRRFAQTLYRCAPEEPGCLRAYREYLETGELPPARCGGWGAAGPEEGADA